MARLFLLTLLGVVLLSASQASLLSPSPDSNPDSGDDIIDEAEVESADDKADDAEVERMLAEVEKDEGDHIEIPADQLDDEELKQYLKLEERIFLGQADEHVAFQTLKENRALSAKQVGPLRPKRWVSLAGRAVWSVARHFARRFARKGITRSGSRVTRHYNGRGSYSDAVKDFNRMKPTDVKPLKGQINGQTGKMGNHRVTVRDRSSGDSKPTLEIRSHGGDLVRKFRYEKGN